MEAPEENSSAKDPSVVFSKLKSLHMPKTSVQPRSAWRAYLNDAFFMLFYVVSAALVACGYKL